MNKYFLNATIIVLASCAIGCSEPIGFPERLTVPSTGEKIASAIFKYKPGDTFAFNETRWLTISPRGFYLKSSPLPGESKVDWAPKLQADLYGISENDFLLTADYQLYFIDYAKGEIRLCEKNIKPVLEMTGEIVDILLNYPDEKKLTAFFLEKNKGQKKEAPYYRCWVKSEKEFYELCMQKPYEYIYKCHLQWSEGEISLSPSSFFFMLSFRKDAVGKWRPLMIEIGDLPIAFGSFPVAKSIRE